MRRAGFMNSKHATGKVTAKNILTNESIGAFLIWLCIVLILSVWKGDTFLTMRNAMNLSLIHI